MVPTKLLTSEECLSRLYPREEDVRGPYFRDQTAIIHCTPFRRLRNKTQVFFSPEHDHVCTRIEHVLHVATIAATICRGLNQTGWGLDTELAYAAGLGHDLGHAPFGHTGERILNKLLAKAEGLPEDAGVFTHEAHSLRVVNSLTNGGQGLNLTRGVRDAIVCHNGEKFDQYIVPERVSRMPEEKAVDHNRLPSTWEGCIVRYSDKIAYLGRDLEDAVLTGFIHRNMLPQQIARELGETNGVIINKLVLDMIDHSDRVGKIGLSDTMFSLFNGLYAFNSKNIYTNPNIKHNESYCIRIIEVLFAHLMECVGKEKPLLGFDFEETFFRFRQQYGSVYARENASDARTVTDFIAGMTDHYATECYKELVLPRPIRFPLVT